ncbi:unnamed protein product, partial [Heterosigma akashiwo]
MAAKDEVESNSSSDESGSDSEVDEGKRSPSPASTMLHVANLSRNVKKDHLEEIFSTYGQTSKVELVVDKRVNLPKGYAFVEFKNREDAEQAQLCMDGGQLDGNVLKVAFCAGAAAA